MEGLQDAVGMCLVSGPVVGCRWGLDLTMLAGHFEKEVESLLAKGPKNKFSFKHGFVGYRECFIFKKSTPMKK